MQPVANGIPQGSPVSPILSVIYTAELQELMESRKIPPPRPGGPRPPRIPDNPTDPTLNMYIDDGNLRISSDMLDTNVKILQSNFIVVNEWLENNGLSTAAEQTELMHHSWRRDKGYSPNIRLPTPNGPEVSIAASDTIRILGVSFDRRLTFNCCTIRALSDPDIGRNFLADAPYGTQACVFDVDSAFRNIPTKPIDRTATAILINGLVQLDGRLNFGICPAPGIFGLIADAIVWIYLHKGIDAVIKWVDDFIFFRYPRKFLNGLPIYSYDESLIWSLAGDLGWPWAADKFVPFSASFTYIGFLWSKLEPWSLGAFVSLHDTESIIGTLNHVCLVVPTGRSHLPALYKFRAAFATDAPRWSKHRVTPAVSTEILWWCSILQHSPCRLDIVRPPDPLDVPIFVDASTSWGIGFCLNGKWLAWKLLPGWKSAECDIGWAEMVAVDLALHAIISGGHSSCHLIIQSDNSGVVGALAAGRSRNSQQNTILRRIVDNFQQHGLWITTNWIPTNLNLADGPSRGTFPPRKLLYPHSPRIPYYLKPFVAPSISFHELVA
ncbi:hypothetical protein D9615_000294 [Tricholomella constricta]|uniref:Reverse transcriptase domain-containing protein n=1 Tax=Tricholomella constricta TaxID=117010 RepID=A0A8H5MBC4_9AGAR|nr:hypothetical protein D9615_000294 [Tricholomella constricta]